MRARRDRWRLKLLAPLAASAIALKLLTNSRERLFLNRSQPLADRSRLFGASPLLDLRPHPGAHVIVSYTLVGRSRKNRSHRSRVSWVTDFGGLRERLGSGLGGGWARGRGGPDGLDGVDARSRWCGGGLRPGELGAARTRRRPHGPDGPGTTSSSALRALRRGRYGPDGVTRTGSRLGRWLELGLGELVGG